MLDKLRFDAAPVIVTGAGSGIGQACCDVLAGLGATVILVGRTGAKLERSAARLAAAGLDRGLDHGLDHECHEVDVADAAQVERLRAAVADRHGFVKSVINNAGVNFIGRITDLAPEDWDRVVSIDLSSVYYMCKAFIPLLAKAPGGGSIVNVASTFGVIGHPEMPAYCAAKGGVLSLTRQLAVDYGREGVRVNSLCPGATLSPRVKGYIDGGAVDGRAIADLAMLGRLAECEEIANAAAFLASDAASYVHGTALVVDGGQTIH